MQSLGNAGDYGFQQRARLNHAAHLVAQLRQHLLNVISFTKKTAVEPQTQFFTNQANAANCKEPNDSKGDCGHLPVVAGFSSQVDNDGNHQSACSHLQHAQSRFGERILQSLPYHHTHVHGAMHDDHIGKSKREKGQRDYGEDQYPFGKYFKFSFSLHSRRNRDHQAGSQGQGGAEVQKTQAAFCVRRDRQTGPDADHGEENADQQVSHNFQVDTEGVRKPESRGNSLIVAHFHCGYDSARQAINGKWNHANPEQNLPAQVPTGRGGKRFRKIEPKKVHKNWPGPREQDVIDHSQFPEPWFPTLNFVDFKNLRKTEKKTEKKPGKSLSWTDGNCPDRQQYTKDGYGKVQEKVNAQRHCSAFA